MDASRPVELILPVTAGFSDERRRIADALRVLEAVEELALPVLIDRINQQASSNALSPPIPRRITHNIEAATQPQYRNLIKQILPSIFVTLFSLFFSAIILLIVWERPLTDLFSLLSIANANGRYIDILMLIIPITTQTALGGVLFISEKASISGHGVNRFFFYTLLIPIGCILSSQSVLLFYALQSRGHMLSSSDYDFINAIVVLNIIALLTSDVLMAAWKSWEPRFHEL